MCDYRCLISFFTISFLLNGWMDVHVLSLNQSINADNKVKIASLGGIEVIITAMSTHQDHNGVQEHACTALGNLAHNDGISCPLINVGHSRFFIWAFVFILV